MPIQLDTKLYAFRRSPKGFYVTLEVGPDSDWQELAAAPLGSAFGVAMVAYDPETGKKVDAPQSPQAMGGHARAAALSPERRSEIATNAAKKRWSEISRAQQAGILCSDPRFQLWFSERQPSTEPRDCAEALRSYLGIHSRAALDDGEHDAAALQFDRLVAEYRSDSGLQAEER